MQYREPCLNSVKVKIYIGTNKMSSCLVFAVYMYVMSIPIGSCKSYSPLFRVNMMFKTILSFFSSFK